MLPFQSFFEDLLNGPLTQISTVSGGDISSAYKVETQTNRFFIKTNRTPSALDMFKSEANGLRLLGIGQNIHTPEVIHLGIMEKSAYLVLEFIETKQASNSDFEKLGRGLANLHSLQKNSSFGLRENNFIGSLPQSNKTYKSWTAFYVQERLLPQFKMAVDSGLMNYGQLPKEELLFNTLKDLFGNLQPSLLHGDLWGGNYLISTNGNPYLIDPAVYYGHSEVDLAMSKLFGGFGRRFYDAYHEIIAPHPKQRELTEIYQLYYLLVHLNLFGASYLGAVTNNVTRFFC